MSQCNRVHAASNLMLVALLAFASGCGLIPKWDRGVFLDNPRHEDPGLWLFRTNPEHIPLDRIAIPMYPTNDLHEKVSSGDFWGSCAVPQVHICTGFERPARRDISNGASSSGNANYDTRPVMIALTLCPGNHPASEFTFDPSKVCLVIDGASHKPTGMILCSVYDFPDPDGRHTVQTNLQPFNLSACPDYILLLFDLSYRQLPGGELRVEGISDAQGPIKLLSTKIVGDRFYRWKSWITPW